MREIELGPLRLRCIEYSADYRSDHYCDLGHVALVLEGEIEILMHGRAPSCLTAGASFAVGSRMEPHLVVSPNGAKLFVID